MTNSPAWRRRLFYALALVPVFFMAAMNPTNVCRTAPDHADARLRTRFYREPLQDVQNTIIATVPTLRTYARRWKLVGVPRTAPQGDKDGIENCTIHVEVPVVVFTDDLSVTLIAQNGGTSLDVRSASRVGRGDFGENRRHVLQLLNTLDKKFGAV